MLFFFFLNILFKQRPSYWNSAQWCQHWKTKANGCLGAHLMQLSLQKEVLIIAECCFSLPSEVIASVRPN